MANITIDGKEYDLAALSDNARAQLSSLQVAEQELGQIQARLALTQTARNAYGKSLADQLPAPVKAEGEGVVMINDQFYSVVDFSDKAKADLGSLQLTDKRIADLQVESAMVQTARNAYAAALKEALNSVQ